MIVLVATIVVALEHFRPYARAWQRDQGDFSTDVLHAVGNVAMNQGAAALYAVAFLAFAGRSSMWPVGAPFALQVLAGVVILDLGLYGVHRASHSVGWLWKLHAIHHSPRRVYWLNGQRRHLLHELIEGLPGLVVLGVLGAPPPIVACAMAIITLHLMFQHANIDYRVGILRYVFATAELHRWHHQRLYADVQGNYAAIFAVWDWLFGSALRKVGDAPLDVGMDDEPDLPSDYVGQLVWPFLRRRNGNAGARADHLHPR